MLIYIYQLKLNTTIIFRAAGSLETLSLQDHVKLLNITSDFFNFGDFLLQTYSRLRGKLPNPIFEQTVWFGTKHCDDLSQGQEPT